MSKQTWTSKVTDSTVAGMTYSDCINMQTATNFEGETYTAKVAEMRAIAAEMGLGAKGGTLCHLHACISAEAIKHTAKRRAFGV